MKWFQGTIADAVQTSKAKNAVFVVFVAGQDELSQDLARCIDTNEVSSRLESEKFVAVKLDSGTENYTFFVQIYQLVPVPSIFFINKGIPLEIISSKLTVEELIKKIDTISNAAQGLHSTESINTAANDREVKFNEVVNSEAQYQPSTSTSGVSPDPIELSEEDKEKKIKRAKELIELQKQKRSAEEELKEREKEIQRRKTGRDVQKMKREQQDLQLKLAYEERQKENAAAELARQKILQQIAEDREERKRKHEMHLKEISDKQKQREEAEKAIAEQKAPTGDMTKARIQFKLPTGGSVAETFDATSTLGMLRSYVVQNLTLPFKQFTMTSSFPRRDLTAADDQKTLLELELVPSSVILILPVKGANSSVIKSSEGPSIFSHFFWSLITPVISMYNYIMGYFTGRPQGGDNPSSGGAGSSGSSTGPNPSLNRFISRRIVSKGPKVGGESTIRSRGNIHTLHSGDDDNDENNTWNGNSTQQM